MPRLNPDRTRFRHDLSLDGDPPKQHRIRLAAISLALLPLASLTLFGGEAYRPNAEDEVLEVLPRVLLASRDELSVLRKQLAEKPNNADIASHLAFRYLELGKQVSDPRFFGYARAAIGPWWDAPQPPSSILRLRAKLKERNHQYDQAIADLRLLLEGQPRDTQAWIELANIYRVQGKYAQAQAACDRLSEFASGLPTVLARAPVQAVSGKAQQAYAELVAHLPTVRQQSPGTLAWMFSILAEISQALGRDEQAEEHYRQGLVESPKNYYLLRSYADFLLDAEREEEVLNLLSEHTRDTGILLRAAIAARRSGEQQLARRWQDQLAIHFEETRLRGSLPHGRFEARFELELRNRPGAALKLALANWKKQKEARDALHVLQAAVALGDSGAAEGVMVFLEKHRTEHVVLQSLINTLRRDQ